MILKNSKIYVAGHNGLVGSAIVRKLKEKGYKNILTASRKKLDLTKQNLIFWKEKQNFQFIQKHLIINYLKNLTIVIVLK